MTKQELIDLLNEKIAYVMQVPDDELFDAEVRIDTATDVVGCYYSDLEEVLDAGYSLTQEAKATLVQVSKDAWEDTICSDGFNSILYYNFPQEWEKLQVVDKDGNILEASVAYSKL